MKNSITLQLDSNIIEKMKCFYNDYSTTPPTEHVKYSFKTPLFSITIYKTNKVVFQGKEAQKESDLWIKYDKVTKSKSTNSNSYNNYEKEHKIDQIKINSKNMIGSDESGAGDFFGPLVAASVLVSKEDENFLKELGVMDSKKLNDLKIKELAPVIISKLKHSIVVYDNLKYNEFIKNSGNIVGLKSLMHNFVLENVINKLNSDDYIVFIDEFVNKKKYFSYLEKYKQNYTYLDKSIFETKAEDKYLCVAAASILARYTFIIEIEKLNQKYETSIPLGAGYQVDRFSAYFVEKFGEKKLHSITKVHFKNSLKYQEYLN